MMCIGLCSASTIIRLIRRLCFPLCLTLLLLLGCHPSCKEPSHPITAVFAKEEANPILVGEPGSWDAIWVGVNSVIKVANTYYMYYMASPPSTYKLQIGLATANTPKGPWKKYKGNPILIVGSPGSWDDTAIAIGRVVKFGDRYYMYYSGFQRDEEERQHWIWRIGLATASAPEGPWTKYAKNPILDVGQLGEEWDGVSIYMGSVCKVNNLYYMWYSGFREHTDEHGCIGLATAPAPEGPWRKYEGNPVLCEGHPGSWNCFGIQEVVVMYQGNLFHMWYIGQPIEGNLYIAEIGYAYSHDGIDWIESTHNPILSRGEDGEWDAANVSEPFMFIEGDNLYLFYTGYHFEVSRFTSGGIGLAIGQTSP